MNEDIQRSLGNIEGTQQRILAELQQFRSDFTKHEKRDDDRFIEIDKERNQNKGAMRLLVKVAAGTVAVLSLIVAWFRH